MHDVIAELTKVLISLHCISQALVVHHSIKAQCRDSRRWSTILITSSGVWQIQWLSLACWS